MRTFLYTFTLICAVLLIPALLQAQVKVYFHFSPQEQPPVQKGRPVIPDSLSFDNEVAFHTWCNARQLQLVASGYLACSFDTVVRRNDSVWDVSIYLGRVYRWARIDLDSIPPLAINKAGLRKLDWQGQAVHPGKLQGLYRKLLGYYENNGYPFARIIPVYAQMEDGGVYTLLKVYKGMLVKIDTIVIKGNVEIAPAFIQQYLGIRQGDLFNEQQVSQISAKIKELTFLQESEPWEMYQTIAGNELILHLKKKRSNQINGLVGLQPSNNETGKMLLTVDALLDLKNPFGYGERITASFQNLQRASPKLLLGAQVPYVLGLPVALEGNFNLYKRDTLFTRINFEGGGRYLLNSRDYFKLSYIEASYRVNYVDLSFVQREKRLPDIVDTRNRGVGIQLFLDHTDYAPAPRKGWVLNINTNILRRNIKENLQISTLEDGSGFDYSRLYDTFRSATSQYKLFGGIEYYYPVSRTFIIKGAYAGGWVEGVNLFMNELYQIGGFKILRGFDEESIFSSLYHIGTLELRMMINSYSFFYGFSDFGWLSSGYNLTSRTQRPLSIGGGLNLQNESGIFRIAVGVGKMEQEPFRLRQAKLHFGYTALF